MPTTRPRHFVTETDDLSRALDEASRRRPDLSRSQLVVHLALQGHHASRAATEMRRRQRLDAVEQHGGALSDVYGANYLAGLREDWSE